VRAFATLAVIALAAGRALAAGEGAALRIELDPPAALGSESRELVLLTGRALAGDGLDLVLALDSSDSTDEPAYESDAAARRAPPSFVSRVLGWLGFAPRERPARTVLSEELRAARALLADLDPRSSRVGIVLLAGEPGGDSRAPVTALPLTSDFARAHALLDWFEKQGPDGQAQWSAGLRRALALLLGLEPAATAGAEPRSPLRRRALLVLSDGRFAPGEHVAAELDALLDQARRADVRIDALVFGEEAARGAPQLHDVARRTGGRAVGVGDAAQFAEAVAGFDHARVAGLEVWNDTLAEPARALLRRPDGSFGSLLRLAPGENQIRVVARAWNGLESRRELRVERESLLAAAEPETLDPAALALRGRLLRTLHQNQIAAGSRARARDLRVGPEAKSPETAPASAAPVD